MELLNRSGVTAFIHAHGLKAEERLIFALEKRLKRLLTDSIERTKANRRRIVMCRDV